SLDTASATCGDHTRMGDLRRIAEVQISSKAGIDAERTCGEFSFCRIGPVGMAVRRTVTTGVFVEHATDTREGALRESFAVGARTAVEVEFSPSLLRPVFSLREIEIPRKFAVAFQVRVELEIGGKGTGRGRQHG